MLQSIKKRVRKRLKPRNDKIYIVPTWVGVFFIFITLFMLLVGAGYSNNLVNLLAFFMFSLIFVGMVVTQSQVKGITLENLELMPAFAETESEASALIQNPNDERFGIEVEIPELRDNKSNLAHLKARRLNRVSWSVPVGGRGKHRLRKVEVHSVFPLGLFYAWKVIPAETEYWVYPQLRGELPIPEDEREGRADSQYKVTVAGGDDFKGHRKFLSGDSPRQIDWKAHARGRPMLLKEFNEGEPPHLVLNFESLAGTELDLEAKLSQLAVWVQDAYQRSAHFVLRLPGQPDLEGRGMEHASRCFQALASFQGAPPA